MSATLARPRAAALIPWLDRAALAALLVLPVFLMHGRSLGEAALGLVAATFLVRSVLAADLAWLRTTWLRIGLVWWAWLVVCSLPGIAVRGPGVSNTGALLQALAMLRFLVFAAAMEHHALRAPAARRWFARVIAACFAYMAVHCLVQAATGANLYGAPRGPDGELTGPFDKPRVGPVLARLLPPVLLPPAARLLAAGGTRAALGGYALVIGGVGLIVLIGQRMPLVLTVLGLAVSALFLARLRRVALAAVAAGVLLIAASPVVAPRSYHRLVDEFSHQLATFGASHYGLIYVRAAAIAEARPLTGGGFDGFRNACRDPAMFAPSLDGRPDGGGAEICTTHPHNFYVQALTDAGVPGLLLFVALATAWLAAAGRGLHAASDPLRVGLFASLVMQLWPIASTSSFAVMPISGWFFLTLGWALAEARATQPDSAARRAARFAS
jgi:hypothetical protein